MEKSPFASPSLVSHIGRGVLGSALFIVALHFAHSAPALSVGFGLGALFVLRGCPLCWLIGLIETLHTARQARR